MVELGNSSEFSTRHYMLALICLAPPQLQLKGYYYVSLSHVGVRRVYVYIL